MASLYDWETGCIVLTVLSHLLMAVVVDLIIDDNAATAVTRDATPDNQARYIILARQYFKVRP